MSKKIEMAWSKEPTKDDYLAAERYLTLVVEPKIAAQLVRRLRKARATQYPARDILRAAAKSVLGIASVKKEREKLERGSKVPPLLLVRDSRNAQVIIADGYHRLCTIYAIDDETMVPCKIV